MISPLAATMRHRYVLMPPLTSSIRTLRTGSNGLALTLYGKVLR